MKIDEEWKYIDFDLDEYNLLSKEPEPKEVAIYRKRVGDDWIAHHTEKGNDMNREPWEMVENYVETQRPIRGSQKENRLLRLENREMLKIIEAAAEWPAVTARALAQEFLSKQKGN